MKKLTRRGFTLVELMIVIAIIGILAAALYPSIMGYLEKSRDTGRISDLRNVALTLANYNVEHNTYPAEGDKRCLSQLSTILIPDYTTKIPTDPRSSSDAYGVTECTTTALGGYGYIKVADALGTTGTAYVLGARVETKTNVNFTGSKWNNTDLKDTTSLGSAPLEFVSKKVDNVDAFLGTDASNKLNWYYLTGQ